jgi:hypothetical protein
VLLFHIPWAYLKSRWQKLPETDIADLERFAVNDAPVAGSW